MRRPRQLDDEHRPLKAIVADQALDIRARKNVLAKKYASGEATDGGGIDEHAPAVAASRQPIPLDLADGR